MVAGDRSNIPCARCPRLEPPNSLRVNASTSSSKSVLPDMALVELRSLLPAGGTGRIINSFIFSNHHDAVEWQRRFRVTLLAAATSKPLGSIYNCKDGGLGVHLSLSKRSCRAAAGDRGWGSITLCRECDDPLSLHLDEIVEGAHITRPSSWYGDMPCGWDFMIKTYVGDRWACGSCHSHNATDNNHDECSTVCTVCAPASLVCGSCGENYGRGCYYFPHGRAVLEDGRSFVQEAGSDDEGGGDGGGGDGGGGDGDVEMQPGNETTAKCS